MIKELRLKNWKSFEDATLYIDPLTILIGPNASGKSNALDALLFLQRVSSGVGIFQAINGDVNLPALRGGAEGVCLDMFSKLDFVLVPGASNPANQFTLEVLSDSKNTNQDYRYELTISVYPGFASVLEEKLVLLTYDSESAVPEEKTLFFTTLKNAQSLTLFVSFSPDDSNQEALEAFELNRSHTILSQIKLSHFSHLFNEMERAGNYMQAQLSRIFIFDPISAHMRGYVPFSENLNSDGSNLAGVLAGFNVDKKKGIEDSITKYLKVVPEPDIKRIWAEPIGRFGHDAMLYCEEGWEGMKSHEIDARSMSDGTLRYLAIITALLTRESGSLLVIEEVDNGLHPSRAQLLIDMLRTLGKERGIDVIVTTHNPALLDAAGISMLPFITVTHRDNKTGVSQLIQLEDIEQLPKLMAFGSLGRLNTEGRIESALKYEDAQ